MGEHRTNASIERVAMAGLPDNSSNGFGFNVINGILYAGELPRSATPFDYYFLSGRLIVRNSSFRGMVDGVGTDGFFKDSDCIEPRRRQQGRWLSRAAAIDPRTLLGPVPTHTRSSWAHEPRKSRVLCQTASYCWQYTGRNVHAVRW